MNTLLHPFTKKFKRHREDFICLVCNAFIKGDGYTNHCPLCLCSRHVDIQPGDRSAICQGIMVPFAKGIDKKGYYIVHRCQGCGIRKKNKIKAEEQQEVFLSLSWDSQK